MADVSAVRNRSARVTVSTPRGRVEVVRQEMKGVRRNSGWAWFWLARRAGQQDWKEATTAMEAIRRAALIAPKQRVAWLAAAAAQAEQHILTGTDEAPGPAA